LKFTVMTCLVCLVAAPALHAQTSTPRGTSTVIGLPIYSSDGVEIGRVTNIGKNRGESSLIGEVGQMLGFGTRYVLIPKSIATIGKDRVVLTITSERVSEMLDVDK
jgi:sporulation protein YlmC with PRC-barrel domain